MPTPILLDCDPGVDDALALLLAAGSPELTLRAVTTVGGNQSLEKVTRNALALTELLGLEAPVAAGAAQALVEPPMIADHVHGDTGLGEVLIPDAASLPVQEHAVDLIVRELMDAPAGELTVVATGPLTNLALALRREPRIAERVREVVVMGGAVATGNATPVAEFNIAVDPEAAQAVLTAGWPVTLVGLDTTHQALATQAVERRLAELGTLGGRLAVELIRSYRAAYRANAAFQDPPCHDPVAMALVLDRSLAQVRRAPVQVELAGTLTRGMTVADLRLPAGREIPTAVTGDLDRERFWDLVVQAASRVDGTGQVTSRTAGAGA